MNNLHELNTLELEQISGGSPISDWVACKVDGFLNYLNARARRKEIESLGEESGMAGFSA